MLRLIGRAVRSLSLENAPLALLITADNKMSAGVSQNGRNYSIAKVFAKAIQKDAECSSAAMKGPLGYECLKSAVS
jgi:hypothetical protein